MSAYPSYKFAVAWIAENDAPGDADALELETVAGYVTTALIADLYGHTTAKVAADVVRYRKKHAE